MSIEVKKSPYLWALSGLIVVSAFAAAYLKIITGEVAIAFITGSLAMPGLLGQAKSDDDDDQGGGQTPLLVGPVALIKSVPPPEPPAAARALFFGTAALAAILIVFGTACSYIGTACKVIEVADDACTVFRYTEEDGTKREVQVTPREMRDFAHATAQKRALAHDGGAQ